MVTRKVGASTAAGNTVVCKLTPETPLCTLALAKLFERAVGLPGVFNVIPSGLETTPEVGEQGGEAPELYRFHCGREVSEYQVCEDNQEDQSGAWRQCAIYCVCLCQPRGRCKMYFPSSAYEK